MTGHVGYVLNSLNTFPNREHFKYADGLPPRGHLVPTGRNTLVVFRYGCCEKTGRFLLAIFFAFKRPDAIDAFAHHLGHGP